MNEKLDSVFKKKILSSLKDLLNGYGRIPNEIKKNVKFNQIPIDVYLKIYDYFEVEKKLPRNTYIEPFGQNLSSIGKKINESFLGTLGFIELIGVNKFNKYNTKELYLRMLDEIRSLPDIKNSDNIIRDYNIFRERMGKKDSPTKDLSLVLPSRFLDEYYYYSGLF